MKKVTKAVIPAAGLGTRVLPATKAMPKGMLPLVDKPAIQYLVEEAVRSGADPAGEAGRALAELHRAWLSFGSSPYDPARHRGLAELYVQDERFTAYYDKSVPGCARFLRDAVAHWVK